MLKSHLRVSVGLGTFLVVDRKRMAVTVRSHTVRISLLKIETPKYFILSDN